MNLTKRIKLLWRVFKLMPRLETLEATVPTLDALESAIPKLETIDRFLPKLEALEAIFTKIEALNVLVERLETMNEPVLIHTNGKPHPQPTPDQTVHDYKRLKLLMQFSRFQGKAREIELEWQKIQQSAHDRSFYNQVYLGKAESEVAHKDGFVRGVQWCIERFG